MGDEGERAFERFRPLNRSPTRSFFVLAIVDREKERGRERESKVSSADSAIASRFRGEL